MIADRFREAMSYAAASVTVVTTDGAAGRAGVTVSAMSSVSADQSPVLLACIHHRSPAAAAILANGVFCVNLLRDDQAAVADRFAGRLGPGDRFAGADWAPLTTGAPRLVDPLAAFDCRLLSAQAVGTHQVLFGQVAEVWLAGAGQPLVYARRAYHSL